MTCALPDKDRDNSNRLFMCPKCGQSIHSYYYSVKDRCYNGKCNGCDFVGKVEDTMPRGEEKTPAERLHHVDGGAEIPPVHECCACENRVDAGSIEAHGSGVNPPNPTVDPIGEVAPNLGHTEDGREIQHGIHVIVCAHWPLIATATANSLVGMALDLHSNGVPFQLTIMENDCYIHRRRDVAVKELMKSPLSHLLFVDADVSFQSFAARKMLDAAIQHKHEVIFGCYPKRQTKREFPLRPLHENGEPVLKRCSGCGAMLCEWGPAGFLMISRTAVEEFEKAYPGLYYISNGTIYNGMFRFKLRDDMEFMGEDVAFMHRYRELGGNVWCMTDLDFGHHGFQSYYGNFEKEVIVPSKRLNFVKEHPPDADMSDL